MKEARNLILVAALVAVSATAQTLPPNSDPYLMPVSPSVINGAHQSQWNTILYVANPGDSFQLDCDVCPVIPARTAATFQRTGPAEPSLIFNFERTKALALRTIARNANGEQLVMDIPVPRLSEFTTGTLRIQSVPVRGKVRTSLRVFASEPRDNAQVRLRIYGATNVLVDEVLTLRTPQNVPAERARFYPASTRIDDLSVRYPTIVPPNDELGIISLIEITPLSPSGLSIWALATATHNETQQFNNFTP